MFCSASAAARRCGEHAWNFPSGKIIGSNTDGVWISSPICTPMALIHAAGPALILGAGGAARAIGAALQDAGAAITFCNRTAERAAALAAGFRAGFDHITPGSSARRRSKDFALLVNTTALGMAAPAGVASCRWTMRQTPGLDRVGYRLRAAADGAACAMRQRAASNP